MKFSVWRASAWGETQPPCDGAHFDGDLWMIEVSDLQTLMEFVQKNGEIILSSPNEIMIYDDHIE